MCIAAPEFSTVGSYRAVYFDGPEPDTDQDGEEIPAWTVYIGDADADPVAQIHKLHHFKSAELLAFQMATDHRLDLIHDAIAA